MAAPYPERRIRVRIPYPYLENPCSPVPVPVPVPSLQKQFRIRTVYVPYNSKTFRTRTFSELIFFKKTRTRTYPQQILLRTRTSVPVFVKGFFSHFFEGWIKLKNWRRLRRAFFAFEVRPYTVKKRKTNPDVEKILYPIWKDRRPQNHAISEHALFTLTL